MSKAQKRNRLLIVDDEPEIRDVLGLMLSEKGYHIRTAANGQEALDCLEEYRPDLILLDINMPRMGGIVFYHNIASLVDGSPRYPVIILTGRGALEDLFKEFKVDAFVSKPFDFDSLCRQIEDILEKRYGRTAQTGLSPAPSATEPPPPLKAAPRVLIADTDQKHVDALVPLFMNANYEVIISRTPKLSLQKASLDQPDAVLIRITSADFESPELGLAHAIRQVEKCSAIPLILYPARNFKITPPIAKVITGVLRYTTVLDHEDPQTLLRMFEKSLQARTAS